MAEEGEKNKTATNPPSSDVAQQNMRFGSLHLFSNMIEPNLRVFRRLSV